MQAEPLVPLQAQDFSGDGLTDLLLLSKQGIFGYQQVCTQALLKAMFGRFAHDCPWLSRVIRSSPADGSNNGQSTRPVC